MYDISKICLNLERRKETKNSSSADVKIYYCSVTKKYCVGYSAPSQSLDTNIIERCPRRELMEDYPDE